MAHSTRSIGIAIASIIAIGCMIIAVLISGPLPFHLNTANAESTHDLLVAYAAKDSDNDGLPDWEEGLYGTDPHNPHSVSPTLTDGQAVAQGLVKPQFSTATSTPTDTNSIPGVSAKPTTLTDQFARELFSQYLSQRGTTQPTPDEIATFVQQAVASLSQGADTAKYSQSQLHVSGNGPDALRSYAASAETIFNAHEPPAGADIFADLYAAQIQNDPAALKRIATVAKDYDAVATGLMGMTVPTEVAAPHLALVNSFANVSEALADLAAMKTDPIRAMVGIQLYGMNAQEGVKSMSTLHRAFVTEGVSFDAGEPGASFYAALQEASTATTTP